MQLKIHGREIALNQGKIEMTNFFGGMARMYIFACLLMGAFIAPFFSPSNPTLAHLFNGVQILSTVALIVMFIFWLRSKKII